VTLTFDILASKSQSLLFVSNSTEVVNFVKLPEAVFEISFRILLVYDHTDACANSTIGNMAGWYTTTVRSLSSQ